MATGETFQCTVVTPERAVLDCEARFVALPAWDGEIGILHDRAPLLCRLGIGQMRLEASTENHVLYLDGGFAEMADNKLTILTSVAKRPDELSQEEIDAALEVAASIQVRDDESLAARQNAQQRARVIRQMK